MEKNYRTFWEFYPFYLSQHQNKVCRILHYIGSAIALMLLFYGLFSEQLLFTFFALISGYAFAWVGHFFFEKNKPATFTYPFYSFLADWVMLFQALTQTKNK